MDMNSSWKDFFHVSLTRAGLPGASLDKGARIFVLGVWLILLIQGIMVLAVYAHNVPFHDEWSYVERATGETSVTPGWLWQQHNEHRIPLPRLVYLGLVKIAGYDVRACMLFNLLGLAGLALALVLVARELRGQTTVTDAFFPLVLLHLGHWENMLWGFQVQFITSTFLAGFVLIAIVCHPERLPLGWVAAIGLAVIGLGLSGSNGLALVPALSCWLMVVGLLQNQGARGQGQLIPPWGLAGFAWVLVGLYLLDFDASKHHGGSSPTLTQVVPTFLQFLAMSLGPGVGGEGIWLGVSLAVILLSLATTLLLSRVFWKIPGERLRSAGMIFFMAGIGCLGLGIAWGRCLLGSDGGLCSRYAALAAPLLCCIYLAWLVYGPPIVRNLISFGLLAAMGLAIIPNEMIGLDAGRGRHLWQQAFEEDVRGGASDAALIEEYFPRESYPDDMAAKMECLRRANAGVFKRANQD